MGLYLWAYAFFDLNLEKTCADLRLRYFGAMELKTPMARIFDYACGRLRINFRKNKSGLIQTFE